MLFQILTFNFKVGFAGEIVAFPDHTGVPSGVGHLWVLDSDDEKVLVDGHGIFLAFVTFLKYEGVERGGH